MVLIKSHGIQVEDLELARFSLAGRLPIQVLKSQSRGTSEKQDWYACLAYLQFLEGIHVAIIYDSQCQLRS